MFLAYYLHDLSPFIWEVTPGFGPRWYGFAYVMAFLAGYMVYHWLSKKGYSQLPPEKVGDFITWGALFGVLLGGRLGSMIFYNFSGWIHDPLMIFRVWEGGMASHGGILGLTLYTWWYARRHKVSWTSIGDNLCVVAPLGLFFGRLANFVNGELYGRPAPRVAWAVQFPKEIYDDPALAERAAALLAPNAGTLAAYAGKMTESEAIVAAARHSQPVRAVLREVLTPRYPSQLIEAGLEGVALFCALWALRTLVKVPRGVITGAFFILYALLRIAGEQFRQPGSDSPFAFAFGFLTYGQLLSLFLILIGIGFLIWGFKSQQYERIFQTGGSPAEKAQSTVET